MWKFTTIIVSLEIIHYNSCKVFVQRRDLVLSFYIVYADLINGATVPSVCFELNVILINPSAKACSLRNPGNFSRESHVTQSS